HSAALAALRNAPVGRAYSQAGSSVASPHRPAGAPPPIKPAKFSSDITADDLRAEVSYLASDALEGRMTGSAGSQLAGEFIAENLRQDRLKPLNDHGYFQDFEFTAGVNVVTNENRLV